MSAYRDALNSFTQLCETHAGKWDNINPEHAARMALEQRRAEVFLEIVDTPVQRGRRDIELLGRTPNRARANHGVHIAKVSKMLHRRRSVGTSMVG